MEKKYLLIALFLLFSAGVQTATAGISDTIWYREMPNSFRISNVKFSPDQQKIFAFSSSAGAVRIINVADGKTDTVLSGYKVGVFTSDGRYMISYGGKNLYKVDLQDFSRTMPFDTAIENIQSVSISDNGLIACNLFEGYEICPNNQLQVWDYNTGKVVFTKEYTPFTDDGKVGRGIGDVQLTKDGNFLIVSVGEGYTFANKYYNLGNFSIVYDMNTKDSVRRIDNGARIYPSKSGKYIAFMSVDYDVDETFFIYDLDLNSIIFRKFGEDRNITDFEFTSDSKYFAISHRDAQKTNVYDIVSGKIVYTFSPPSFSSIDITNDKQFIVGSNPYIIGLWPFESLISTVELPTLEATITYPNPVQNIFNLEFNLTVPNMTSIDLIDLTGNTAKIIDNKFLNLGNHLYTVDISDLPVGAYTLRINSGNYSYTNQIIKN